MNRPDILYAEDRDEDAYFALKAIRECDSSLVIERVRDGQEVLNFLFRNGSTVFPKLIILDFKMPRIDGLEVLQAIRAHENTRSIPVVIVSGSGEISDIQKAKDMGVNSYIIKPINADEFRRRLRLLCEYWMKCDALTM